MATRVRLREFTGVTSTSQHTGGGRRALCDAAPTVLHPGPSDRDASGTQLRTDRINGGAVDANLKVHVRSGRKACAADAADHLPLAHARAGTRQDRGEVRVQRGESVAVVDDDDLAVTAEPAGVEHGAVPGRDHRRAARRGDVYPAVHAPDAEDGMVTHTVSGGEDSARRPEEAAEPAAEGPRAAGGLHPPDQGGQLAIGLLQVLDDLLVERAFLLNASEQRLLGRDVLQNLGAAGVRAGGQGAERRP